MDRERPSDRARSGAHLASLLAVLPRYVRRVEWPRERIDAYRQRRLRALIRAALEGSPWHRDRLRGIDPERVRLADLASLPTMTKAELIARWDDAVTDRRLTLERLDAHAASGAPGAYLFGRYRVIASAGSSGARAVLPYDGPAWRAIQAGSARMTLRDRLRRADLRPGPVAVVGAGRWDLAASAFTPAPFRRHLPVTCPRAKMIDALNAMQPRTLAGYPSMLGELAQEAFAGRLRIRPSRVIASGEPLGPAVRDAAREAWGARVANVWACAEAGALAAGCFEAPGMHVHEDLVIVEPVDERGRPVPPGTRAAKVLVTSLESHALPILRYELSDQVTMLDEPCPCGSALARVADVEGRLDDMLEFGRGARRVRAHPHLFRSALMRDRGVLEYQVIQRPRGAEILVRLRGPADLSAIEREIAGALRALGLERPEVRVRAVTALARGNAGKVQRFVPLSA